MQNPRQLTRIFAISSTFGEDTAAEFVCRSLANHVDPNYAAFMRPLVPTVDPRRLVGVRTPQLRKIARELYRRDDASVFMRSLPHVLFEESQVHAFAIGMEREYERAIELYDLFLPHVGNWATCDQLPVRVLAEQPARTLECARRWMGSEHGFTVRFGIGVLMRLFLDDLFEPRLSLIHISGSSKTARPVERRPISPWIRRLPASPAPRRSGLPPCARPALSLIHI